MQVKLLQIFFNLLKMCGPQIQLCLFMLKSLTTLDSLSRLGGAVVTHPLWVQELTGSIPGSCKGFLCLIFCFVVDVILLFVQKTHYLSQSLAIFLQW